MEDDLPEGFSVVQEEDLPEGFSVVPTQPQVDTSPFKYKPRNRGRRPAVPGAPGYIKGQENQPWTIDPELEKAAAAGVDIDSGGPFGASVYSSFGVTPEEKMAGYAAYLKEKNGTDIPVRMGPDSGQIEYLDPTSKRWTTSRGLSNANIIGENTGGAVETIPGIAASVGGTAGGFALGGPAGAVGGGVLGAGAGAGVGRAARLKIGKKVGAIPESVDTLEEVKDAAITGGAYDLAGQAALGGLKYARYWFRGSKPFGANEAGQLISSARAADNLVAEIEARSGRSFNPTIAQRAGANLQDNVDQLALREKAMGLDQAIRQEPGDVGQRARGQQAENELALRSYLDNLLADDTARFTSREQVGRDLEQGILSSYNQHVLQARATINSLPPELQATQAGGIMRSALADADSAFKASVEDPAWATYRRAQGFNAETFSSNIQVPWSDEASSLMKGWSEKSEKALIQAAKNDNSGLKLIFKETPPGKVLGPDGKPLIPAGIEENVDLASLDDTIKWLRSDARKALNNQQGVTFSERDLVQLERTLTRMRDGYLRENHPQLSAHLDAAEQASRDRAMNFKRGMISDLLVRDETGAYKLSDADVVYRIISNRDDSAAAAFARLTQGYPQAAQEARNMLYAMYRRGVVDLKTGLPSVKNHDKFMRDYGQVMRNFFQPNDWATLNHIGGMGEVLARDNSTLRKVLPQLRTVFGAELESVNAPALIDWSMGRAMTPSKLRSALTMIRRLPNSDALIDQWRSGVADAMAKKLVDKKGMLNETAINSILNGPQREGLETLFNQGSRPGGHAMIAGLETLRDAARLIRETSKKEMPSQQRGPLIRLLRLLVPQFGTESRMITFGQRTRESAVPSSIYRALTDPNEMTRLANQTNRLIRQIQLANISSGVAKFFAEE